MPRKFATKDVAAAELERQTKAVGRVVSSPDITDKWPLFAKKLVGPRESIWLGRFPKMPIGVDAREFGALDYSRMPVLHWDVYDRRGELIKYVTIPPGIILDGFSGELAYGIAADTSGDQRVVVLKIEGVR